MKAIGCVLVFAFAGVGCGPPSEGPFHCGDTSSACVDIKDATSKADAQDLCAQLGIQGPIEDGYCAHAGAVGVCVMTGTGGAEEDWWGYPPTYAESDLQSFCESKQGSFAASAR